MMITASNVWQMMVNDPGFAVDFLVVLHSFAATLLRHSADPTNLVARHSGNARAMTLAAKDGSVGSRWGISSGPTRLLPR